MVNESLVLKTPSHFVIQVRGYELKCSFQLICWRKLFAFGSFSIFFSFSFFFYSFCLCSNWKVIIKYNCASTLIFSKSKFLLIRFQSITISYIYKFYVNIISPVSNCGEHSSYPFIFYNGRTMILYGTLNRCVRAPIINQSFIVSWYREHKSRNSITS